MPRLTRPTTAVHASFLGAMAELRAEGAGAPEDDSTLGRTLRAWEPAWRDPEVFRAHVRALRAESRPVSGAGGRVPRTTWWYAEGDVFLGRIALRHALAPEAGPRDGHIGYFVRPSARRLGHACAMLGAVLPLAAAAGIDPALVTCDVANTASRRVIERCGGHFQDAFRGKLRFLVPASGSAAPPRLQG